MLLALFILGIIPACLVGRKFVKRQEISFFDIFALGNTLYFLLIPYKGEYIDHTMDVGSALDTSIPALLLVVLFLWLLVFFDSLWGQRKAFALTRSMVEWDEKLPLDKVYIYLLLISATMMLYKVTDYSALTVENNEANNQLYFGSDMPLGQRIIWLFALGARPLLALMVFKIYRTHQYKKLSLVALGITLASFVLGPKTDCVLFVFFVCLYFYSLYRTKITQKQICKYSLSVIVALSIFFPLSQGLRLAKQTLVMQGNTVDFGSTVDYFLNSSALDQKANEESTARYIKGRSLNVFKCLDWTCKKSFRGNGELTGMIVLSVLPVTQDALGVNGNILGDVYLFKGADIGESILAWFNADFYGFGIVVAALFFCVVVLSFYKYYQFLSRVTGSSVILGFYLFESLKYAWSIECAPSSFYHAFYVDYLWPPLTLFVLLKFFKFIKR